MTKNKISGPALFMYCVIGFSAFISITSFYLYYNQVFDKEWVLWCGITFFTVMYHLWMRIIFGNITKLFKLNYDSFWYKEKKFEAKLYKILKVKKWKNKALTYNPELFSIKDYPLIEIVKVTVKAETDHWINELISLSVLLFSIVWGKLWIFAITSFCAMLFDAQFIIIQRFNRPRLIKIINKKEIENGNNKRQIYA